MGGGVGVGCIGVRGMEELELLMADLTFSVGMTSSHIGNGTGVVLELEWGVGGCIMVLERERGELT